MASSPVLSPLKLVKRKKNDYSMLIEKKKPSNKEKSSIPYKDSLEKETMPNGKSLGAKGPKETPTETCIEKSKKDSGAGRGKEQKPSTNPKEKADPSAKTKAASKPKKADYLHGF